MKNGLSAKLRRKWDSLVVSDVAGVGLSECRPFLENKTANDIFYEGLFNGRPCIVKCSSRAADSIRNEYEMLKRMHDIAPTTVPEPFALHEQEGAAFVVIERIVQATENLSAQAIAKGVLAIAEALASAGIVHRDVRPENFIVASDGSLRLIDFQFAVNRDSPVIDPYLRRHSKYHYITFGRCRRVGRLCRWSDAPALIGKLVPYLPDDSVKHAIDRIRELQPQLQADIQISPATDWRLRAYRLSLAVQHSFWSLFHRGGKVAWRLEKINQFFERTA